MRKTVLFATAVDAGVLLTFITGLLPATPTGLVGAAWFGWPMAWLYRLVIAPQYFPFTLNWAGLIVDFVAWFIIALIFVFIINAARKRK
ncbi:MAG: hypothetical protein M1160_03025 [Candidatus Marsarchaeota archaeon]|jgi:hypothetical protein|nr:hypothetical protein [Candidatus Marsarchaeota archaeon]MCL5111824.1 hypothetical protein [Candidatus Marsarchaeota archaeon]